MSGEDDSSRKISEEHENPLDNILIDWCEKLCPHLKTIHFTPNMITLIGLLVGLLSVKYLYLGNRILAFGLFWFSYFLDCLDGHYARKYSMETEFGDYFDHFRDFLIFFLIIVLIIYKANNKKLTLFVILIFLILLLPHIGCQESHSEYVDNNKFLQSFKSLCRKKHYIKITRFFGCGTFVVVLSILILYPL